MEVTGKNIDKLLKSLAFWLVRWKRDPLAYVIECVGDVPTYQQAKILRAIRKYRFVAVRSGHGIGKSKLCGWLTNWYLDTHSRPGQHTRVPITGAGGSQLESTMWPEVSAVNSAKWEFLSKRYEVGTDRMKSIEFAKNWFAVLRTARAENPDALQGFHECFFMIDEASGVDDKIFEVARGAMGDPDSYGLMTGNPTKLSGYFYKTFQGENRVWHTMHFSSADSLAEKEYSYQYVDPLGNIQTITHKGRQTTAWVEDMKNEYGEKSNVYKIRVLGEFASGDDDNVVEPRWTEHVFDNPKPNVSENKLIMGVDPARTGNDDTALVIRQGRMVKHVETWHGADLFESRHRVTARQKEWNCDTIGVDIIGIGAGLHDELRGAGYPVFAADVREKAPEDNDALCATMRDWLWWRARIFFRKGNICFEGDAKESEWKALREEIIVPTYSFRNGKVVVESKDDMKKRGFRSPNRADALNITFLVDFPKNPIKTISYQNMREKLKKLRARGSFKTM